MARMSNLPPVPSAMVFAAVMALRVVLRRPPSMSSATTSTSVMTISFSARVAGSEDLGFVLELVHEVVDRLDEHACLAGGGQLNLEVVGAGGGVDAEARQGLLCDRLLLRLHDALERSVASALGVLVRRGG